MKLLASTEKFDMSDINRQDSDPLTPIREHREEIEQIVDGGKLPTHLNSLARVLLALEAGHSPADGDLRATGLSTEDIRGNRTRKGRKR